MRHPSRRLRGADLTLIAQQLWPGLEGPDFLASTGPAPAGWVPLEEYAVATWRGRAIMVLPSGPALAARALTDYALLRPRSRRLLRRAWAGALSMGLPTARVALHARRGSEGRTALAHAAGALGRAGAVTAAMSVRRTANRKALLHLLTDEGKTVGFAKLAWNPATAQAVTAETRALAAFASDEAAPHPRMPGVLAAGEANGFPYLLTTPLPPRIRRANPAPTLAEYAAVAGPVRTGRATSSAHVRALRSRLDGLLGAGEAQHAAGAVGALLARIEEADLLVPIGTRWHGDFSPWNAGRDEAGRLWLWDLENSHPDALFGLDIVHWHASVLRAAAGLEGILGPPGVEAAARDQLAAAGLDEPQRRLLHAVYRAEIALRALEAGRSDGWGAVWVTPEEVRQIASP